MVNLLSYNFHFTPYRLMVPNAYFQLCVCCFLSTFAISLCRFERNVMWFSFAEYWQIFFGEILVSLVQLNLSAVYSLHLCACFNFFQQFSSSSRRWEKLDPTPYVRIMQLIDHKVCRSSFVCSFVCSFVRRGPFARSVARSLVPLFSCSLVRSCARSHSLVRLSFSQFCFPRNVETTCNVPLRKLQGNSFIHLSLIFKNQNLRPWK